MKKWILVGTICVRKFLFSGSVKANGVILTDIVNQLNTTYSLVGSAFALQNGIAYLISPLILFLLTYVTGSQLCIVGGLIGGLGYIYCGLLMTSVLDLFVGMFISGLGFGLIILPSSIAQQYHFEPAELPLIISGTALFDYIGVASLPPILQLFRSQYGVKNSMILLGAIVWNTITCGLAVKISQNSKGGEKQSTAERNLDNEEAKLVTDTKGVRKQFANMKSLFQHKNIGILLIVECTAFFIFASWAIFLVSLGRTLGLSDQESVFLSTAGGLGGFTGRIIVYALLKLNIANAFTSTFIPCLTTGIVFVITVMSTNFYIIFSLIFISGMSLGLNSSSIISMIPGMVCPYHYRQILVFEYVACGVGTQLSGFISGTIHDLMGSTIYVYLFNAMLSFTMIPLSLWWACDPEPNLKCDKSLQ